MERAEAFRLGIFVIWATFCLFPIGWIGSLSFQSNEEAAAFPPHLVPETFTLENYVHILNLSFMRRALINTLIVAILASILAVLVTSTAGFAFSRYDFKGKNLLLASILGLFMIHPMASVIPIFTMFAELGLTDSLLGLIVVHQSLFLPFNLFLFKNYFDTIPRELDEAALVDGCTQFGAFRRILLPVSIPAIIAAFIFAFRFSWNEFVLAQTLVLNPRNQLFMPAIYNFMGKQALFGYLSASLVIAVIPVLIILILFQKYLVQGITAGAVRK